jgi:hypothetical protein
MSRRGSALLHVLVVTVVLGLIGAMVLRLRLQTSVGAAGAVDRTAQDLSVQSAVNTVSAAWAVAGRSCTSDAGLGVVCFGSGCACTCTLASGAKVAATPSTLGAACQLSVVP